jgi:predicted N-formylglutamate amidohydrolase
LVERFVISCEHGGNRVPESYRSLFRGGEKQLPTHRGYDLGVLPLAERFARELDAPLYAATVTRLLVDLNRSIGSRTLFSAVTRDLDSEARQKILAQFYFPYRRAVAETVGNIIRSDHRVIHLSVHSFTPVFDGKVRNADVGLLYDPARFAEKEFCRRWQRGIEQADSAIRVRRNYPYRGVSDSVVTSLREVFGEEAYLGIEIEINQQLPTEGKEAWEQCQRSLLAGLPDAW